VSAPNSFIYLASQSPRRSQLLTQLGVEHRLLLPDAEEDSEALEALLPGEAPLAYVQRVTDLKLQAALARLHRRQWPLAPVLCSDTTVALGRSILGKPQDAADAARMLGRLAGRSHRVLTAIALGDGAHVVRACSVSRVTFAPLSANDNRHLRGLRRAHGQGGCLRGARVSGRVHWAHGGQLLWHHGLAFV